MITVQMPTEPSYWGSTATDADVARAIGNLEEMVRREFSDAPFEIRFERLAEPVGRGIHGDDQEAVEEIFEFISAYWTAAL
jgi:hypothetical protein